MTTHATFVQPAFRISLIAGLVILALTGMSMTQEPARPCGALPANYAPIIAFELARSDADLRAIFGATRDACRSDMISRMDAVNWIDVLVFIPLYGVFMAAFFAAMRARREKLATRGIQITVLALGADYFENVCLMLLTPALDASSVWFALLPWATGVKWLALGAAAATAALIFMKGSPRNYVAAAVCVGTLVATILAMASPAQFGPWLSAGVGASWVVFLVTAGIGAFRKIPVVPESHALESRE
ncbi:MAG: hypothetical protein ACREV5_18285 [Steroidobacter sp.]